MADLLIPSLFLILLAAIPGLFLANPGHARRFLTALILLVSTTLVIIVADVLRPPRLRPSFLFPWRRAWPC